MPLVPSRILLLLFCLIAVPATAKEHTTEGKVAFVEAHFEKGLFVGLMGELPLCADKSGPIKTARLTLFPTDERNQRARWLLELLLEAKRSGRSVRLLSTPESHRGVRHCRLDSVTLL